MVDHYHLPAVTETLSQIVPQVATWARQAGQIALDYFYGRYGIQFKPDNTPLTPVDVAMEQFLMAQINAAYPEHGRLGEEGSDDQDGSTYRWVIDPLDGTSAFTQGLPGWGIALSLFFQTRPVFGLFYMPLLDDMTYTTGDTVFCQERDHIRPLAGAVKSSWGRNGFLAVNTMAHTDFELKVLRTRSLGSINTSLVYVARGSAVAAFIPRAYLWDLAAGGFILQQAGGELRYLSGWPVDYQALRGGYLAPEPIIAGHSDILDELQHVIRPRVKTT